MKLNKGSMQFEMKPKGLVVDDDKQWQDSFARYLSDSGLVPSIVSSLKEADDLLDREFFHVALVDMSLVDEGNRDGLIVLRKIYQELREGTVAVFITAYGGVEEGAEANTHGARVIEKPKATYSRMQEEISLGLKTASSALSQHRIGLNLLTGAGTPEERQVHEYNILRLSGLGYAAADELTTKVLRDLHPVLKLKDSPNAITDEAKRLLVGTYWSKMLGSAFGLMLGDASSVRNELEQFEANPAQYAGGCYQKILRVEEERRAVAVIFKASEPPFESFDLHRDSSLYRQAPRSSAS